MEGILVTPAGIEPTTYCLGNSRSIQLSYGALAARYIIPTALATAGREGSGYFALRNIAAKKPSVPWM